MIKFGKITVEIIDGESKETKDISDLDMPTYEAFLDYMQTLHKLYMIIVQNKRP